jgi:hypothetical protein
MARIKRIDAGGAADVPKTPVPINVPSREYTTQQQVDTLLRVCGMLAPIMYTPLIISETPRDPIPRNEANVAAENAVRAACEQLEAIVSDTTRWDNSFQKTVEDGYNRATEANRQLIEAETKVAMDKLKPHIKYGPKLMKLETGEWLAICGDPAYMEHAVLGVGASPAEAFLSFDLAYYGTLTPSAMQFIEKYEQAGQEIPQMDPGTNHPTQGAPPSGEDSAGNSPGIEPVR